MTNQQIFEISLIAVSLAMDAFAVAVSSGVILKQMKLKHAMRIASFFGFFQALMPVIGWISGRTFYKYICSCEHWIAFVLLSAVGGKMIYEALQSDKEANFDPLNVYVLFMLAIATSIDALAAGVTFSFLNIDIWQSVFLIGTITFIISLIGTQIGKTFGHLFENQLEILGGIILIGIGIKILIQHKVLIKATS